ncbi:ABC transporter substrate-binding protein [Nocardioides piscis]|uniref:ABC transporter substrate-binding protein n=1 Tax=Nocardioides piscis TaxID=2714938 RepID=A0A6G7YFB6_9ACTN|nr:ABC transporter substrate-binding protein [Nocardioides piscis]QIK75419.1 ABC transporter substrate-binding protein [Nocardioides piscis]
MRRHTRVVGPLAVALAATLVLGACGAGRDSSEGANGGATDAGVTSERVTIGGTFPLTGVAAPGYSEIPTGMQAYFQYVNAQGGVHGRKIDFLVKDDGYNPSNTSTVTNELVLQDEVFATVGSLGTPTQAAVTDFLKDEGVPQLMVSTGSLQWGDNVEELPRTFGWQPDYESEGKIIGQWVAENMPDAKVGLFLQDDDLGEDAEKGVRQFLDEQIVAVERYTSGNTEVAPQVNGLQAKKADLVLSFNTPSYTALTQLAALKTGYKPKWFYASIGSDPELVGTLLGRFSEGAVEGSAALDGVMTTEYIPGIDSADDPWVQLWQKVWDKHGQGVGGGELTNYRIYGMSLAYAFAQALDAAGEELTREGIVEAIEENGADWEGPQLAPLRYSAESHMGIAGMRIVELQAGQGEPLTDVLVTDIGDAEITPDDSGQADDAPPENGVPTS